MFAGETLSVKKIENHFLELIFDSAVGLVNKLDKQTLDELNQALTQIKQANNVSGLLITSGKPAFIVGADITQFKQMFDASEYENKIVKVIVRKKTDPKNFEKFLDKLYHVGIQDLKIVENFEIHENEDFEIDEEENTISILNRYIEESEVEFDKNIIKNIFQDLYRQACEVE